MVWCTQFFCLPLSDYINCKTCNLIKGGGAPRYVTKLHLVVRLELWGVSCTLSLLSDPLWPSVVGSYLWVKQGLVWSRVKLEWFLWLNPFYAQINKGHLRKAEKYSGWNIVSTKHYKGEDNSSKNHNQNKEHNSLTSRHKLTHDWVKCC